MSRLWRRAAVVLLLIAGCAPTPIAALSPPPPPAMAAAPPTPSSPPVQGIDDAVRHDLPDRPPAAPPVDARTPEQKALASCAAADGSWRCKSVRPRLAAGAQPIIPPAWTIGTWFVDPANSTGTASDANDCVTSATPCLTYQEIAVHRWGTNSPRLRQSTTITFLSSHSDNTDQVYFNPIIENAAVLSIQGVLGAAQQVATGTLGTVTAKTRSTGQLLNAVLPAGVAVGQLVVNATHSSRAWTYKNVSGSTWAISQPLAPMAVPGAVTAEVDTWTAGDSVTVYMPVSVNVAGISGTLSGFNGAFNNGLTLYQLAVFSPGGSGTNSLVMAGQVMPTLKECQVNRFMQMMPTTAITSAVVANVDIVGGGYLAMAAPNVVTVVAGQVRAPGGIQGTNASMSSDIVLGGTVNVYGDASSYSNVYLDSGKQYRLLGGQAFSFSSGTFWGPGGVDVRGQSRLRYTAGAGGAAATFLQTGGLTINGQTSCIFSPLGGPLTSGKTVSAANLDTDCGAAAGTYFVAGSGSITNQTL